ncbi:MAG: SMC-Scp complex subunit ScpB [Ferruginibacter sp.]|nr:SMC-Scp complex subunit ScpB [Cytophagales bacterium]
MSFLQNHVEALIFCAPSPIKLPEIQACLTELLGAEIPPGEVEAALRRLLSKYESDAYCFQVYRIAEGYQFLTKSAYQDSIRIFLKQRTKKRLSVSALETMAIIAYKQPVTKTEVERIRGVNCDYAIQKLLDKELIVVEGKSETAGRPILYGTGYRFMEYFGINSLRDLPQPRDFVLPGNEVGDASDA